MASFYVQIRAPKKLDSQETEMGSTKHRDGTGMLWSKKQHYLLDLYHSLVNQECEKSNESRLQK
ncbi:hypothetical protein ACTXT7_015530 [Hymenolepis weldensis]